MANQLQYEKSPYLLQHKENPVEWYPWGEEAFAKAKREDKPVFLSIGYSTCHWCHVMAHESFEDTEVAEILNRSFVAIKVDREERPDIDAVYMGVCQMMTGSGGWPLTLLMTPEQRPFFAGTYFPKRAKYGMAGLTDLLLQVEKLWKTERHKLMETGEQITRLLQEGDESPQGVPEKVHVRRGAEELLHRFDPQWGGFGRAPKFPTPHNILFLLRYGMDEEEEQALQAADKTLESMARGGIFDHIGGGFSRYSTDEKWMVPHFEKMLYDNALLAYTYLEAYRLIGKDFYRRVAEKTIAYVLRELTDEEDGFYCGQDADSEGVEGKYYVFTPQEIQDVLQEDGEVFCRWFHITESGNFEGKNIPNRLREKPLEKENEKIEVLAEKVYDYRKKRTPLHKDDKILTSWNGMMIGALAKAAFLCEKAEYATAAIKAVDFIEKRLTDEKGRLFLRYRDKDAAHMGQLDDYAFFAFGLLELYHATLEMRYLEKAVQTAEQILAWFADEKGGFYLYAKDAEQLIQRPKETYDGAIPSGNSMAAYVFGKLAALTGEEKWQKARDTQLAFLAGVMGNSPSAHCFGLYAMCDVLYPSEELVCVSAESEPPEEMGAFLRESRATGLTVLYKTKENSRKLGEIAPFTAEYSIPQQGTAYYVCKGNQCFAPQKDLEEVKRLLSE